MGEGGWGKGCREGIAGDGKTAATKIASSIFAFALFKHAQSSGWVWTFIKHTPYAKPSQARPGQAQHTFRVTAESNNRTATTTTTATQCWRATRGSSKERWGNVHVKQLSAPGAQLVISAWLHFLVMPVRRIDTEKDIKEITQKLVMPEYKLQAIGRQAGDRLSPN